MVSVLLAEEFLRAGHAVKLITQTPAADPPAYPFAVIRQPRPWQLIELVRWCDVYFQNHISLLTAWPLLFLRRPWIVTSQIWLSFRDSWKGRCKYVFLKFATNIAISQAIAEHLSSPAILIPNPYDDGVFRTRSEVSRDRDLIFVGRLVSDKGLHLLLEALAQLRQQGGQFNLTVVGTGPEEVALHERTQKLGLGRQVEFVGLRTGEELAVVLNAHRVLVVPSLWQEPFGIVALEGIACGCVVVGSAGGGLGDAIGPCGVTFPNGDSAALAQRLADLFAQPPRWQTYQSHAPAHLLRHTKAAIARAYLRIFESALHNQRCTQ